MKNLYIFISILILSVNLYATNYTVSSASEISSVMASAQPGDTLFMKSGIWKDQKIKFRGSGTADQPIVLKAEEEGKVFVTGNSYLRIGGNYLVVDGLYFIDGYASSGSVIEFRDGSSNKAYNCRLTNTAIVNYNPSDLNDDYKWVSLYGQYNRVDHCYLKGKRNSGTTLVVWMDSEVDYHLIDHNYFAERPELGYNGGETIRIGTSDWSMLDSRCIVEYNLFERCDGEIEIISNKSGHNIYRYNTFLENQGTLTLRHGNDCEVYSNFFFGNDRSQTGGVRIIGERHKVYNNYFENLAGNGYRAALCMVLGVDNSPLNRYFQVKNAEVVNNTFVKCNEVFAIGTGSSSDQSLPPVDCIISNNIANDANDILVYDNDPINMSYSNNIFFDGDIEVSPVPAGISEIDPLMELASDNLWRPVSNSPAVDGGNQSFTYVTDDFDGHTRSSIDIGGDEYSTDPVVRKPVTDEDVGPAWDVTAAIPDVIVNVEAGQDSLLNAIANSDPGTVIQLVTDGGIYPISTKIIVEKNIIIRAKSGLTTKPQVIHNNSGENTRMLFEIRQGGDLELIGLDLNGQAGTSINSKYLIRTDDDPFGYEYRVKIDSCILRDVVYNDEGNFFKGYKGTLAREISISNSLIYNCGREAIRLDGEDEGSAEYNAKYIYLSNNTFYNIPHEVIVAPAGDNVPFTPGPKVIVDHCTFYNCGYEGTATILPEEADSSVIKNSIFENCSNGANIFELAGLGSKVEYSTIYNSGSYTLTRGAVEGKRVLEYEPKFNDASNADFTLSSISPVLMRAVGKSAMGDLRWATNTPTKYPLDVEISGNGSVTFSPEAEYNLYDQAAGVTITAIPADGHEFIKYSGDVNSENNPLNIMMFGAMEITAEFDVINSVHDDIMPESYRLMQNYPNPFNPSTNIRFELPESAELTVNLYTVTGEKVRTITSGYFSSGRYNIKLNADGLSSGIYFVELAAEEYRSVIKINLLR